MKALIDIGHPAHVHFFKNALRLLEEQGWQVIVTSRIKECATELLDELSVRHVPLSRHQGGLFGLARELVLRDRALVGIVRRERPDVLLEIGGTFVAHAGWLTGTPSIVFYDTENARLQNALTYPFASCVAVPRAYRGWTPRHRHLRYAGYHELAYLHPRYFTPSRAIALANGLAPAGDTFLIRLVSWKANHDVGERGWNADLLRTVVRHLAARGTVLVSAEAALPTDLERLRYRGSPGALHHVLAHCRALAGESATLSSEASVLGVPSVYAASTGRGYTDEQEQRYGLVRNFRRLDGTAIVAALDEILREPEATWSGRRSALLADTVDVTDLIVALARDHRAVLREYQERAA